MHNIFKNKNKTGRHLYLIGYTKPSWHSTITWVCDLGQLTWAPWALVPSVVKWRSRGRWSPSASEYWNLALLWLLLLKCYHHFKACIWGDSPRWVWPCVGFERFCYSVRRRSLQLQVALLARRVEFWIWHFFLQGIGQLPDSSVSHLSPFLKWLCLKDSFDASSRPVH